MSESGASLATAVVKHVSMAGRDSAGKVDWRLKHASPLFGLGRGVERNEGRSSQMTGGKDHHHLIEGGRCGPERVIVLRCSRRMTISPALNDYHD